MPTDPQGMTSQDTGVFQNVVARSESLMRELMKMQMENMPKNESGGEPRMNPRKTTQVPPGQITR